MKKTKTQKKRERSRNQREKETESESEIKPKKVNESKDKLKKAQNIVEVHPQSQKLSNDSHNNDNNSKSQQDISKDKHNPQLSPQKEKINNSWEIYYDPTYNQNFYYNSITRESVWTLPEGASLSTVRVPTQAPETIQETTPTLQMPQTSYQEIECIPEEELISKLTWEKFKKDQLKKWMERPARQQVKDTRKDTAYIEGNYDYNIWYDKYLTDRKEEKEQIPAMYKCNPGLDTGFTRADKQEKEGSAFFCLYFAKGCCSEGVNCHYYHRVPTLEDAVKIENLRDIFGRSRFATPLKDNGGVGVFTKECRTLLVSDIKKVESKNPVKDMVKIIYDNFSPWGEIEDINYIPMKSVCYIRYAHRCFAEFAKEAMMKQSLVGEEILTVKWSYNDPNPMSEKILLKEEENKFIAAVKKKEEEEKGNGEIIKNCVQLQAILQNIEQYNKDDDNNY